MANNSFDSLVSQLSKAARAAFPFVKSLANTAAPKSAIHDFLSSNNIPIRRQTASDLIDLLRDKGDLGQFVRTFGENTPFASSVHRLSPTKFAPGIHYQYTVEIESENDNAPGGVHVSSEVRLSANEVFARAVATLTGQSFSPEEQAVAMAGVLNIVDARYRPGEELSNADLPTFSYDLFGPS